MSNKRVRPVQVVRGLFSKEVHSEISDFVNNYTKFIPMQKDRDLFMRDSANNVPYIENIHYQLSEYASKAFGEKVKPSYSFLSMYKSGGTCPLHIDREQCRYTIDYLVNDSKKENWSIRISDLISDEERIKLLATGGNLPTDKENIDFIINNNKWDDVVLNENDAVLYSGTHSWHYRPNKIKGSANLIFFHFVPEDFNGPLN